MSATPLEAALRRDGALVAAALAAAAVLAWAYVLRLAAQMGAADGGMAGMDMAAAAAPGLRIWAPADALFILAMWAVMMVGMMTPSVAPMVLLYARVGRAARANDQPFAATGWFFAGYMLVWAAFSIAATGVQWLLAGRALLSPSMAAIGALIGGLVLVAAGIYQWTPIKEICLRQCRTPIAFLASHGGFRSDPAGALRLGIAHGAYCLGCCWALMALLFVGGVMNVLWIAGIAILILLEKTIPAGTLIPRLSGALLAVSGIWLVARAL